MGSTGDFMKNVPTANCALRDGQIVSIEGVYTPSTFYIKSVVAEAVLSISQAEEPEPQKICGSCTGDFMKKVPTATCALRDRQIVSIELVLEPAPRSKFYIYYSSLGKIVWLKKQFFYLFYIYWSFTFSSFLGKKYFAKLKQQSIAGAARRYFFWPL